MKRYKITTELTRAIRNSGKSLDKISQLASFNVKNIVFYNGTIREDHLQKLRDLLKFNLQLEEVSLDYGKNLGEYAVTKPIKSIKESEELAEFIGMMLGDGCLFDNQIDISFDARAKRYIAYVKNLVRKLTGLDLKEKATAETNQFHLYCCNKFFAEKLIELGLKRGSKIRSQVGIPDWIKNNKKYSKRCLKDLVDTDGCIIFCKRDKQKSINFSNHNLTLLGDFKEVAKSLGYRFAKANKWNTRLYRKTEVARFINHIKPFKSMGL